MQLARSRQIRLVFTAGAGVLALALAVLAARHFAETPWPFSRGHPGLLVAAGALSLLGYGFKAFGWQRLFAAHERPQPLALAAANGGASITALALPGRFDDIVRIAIVRRFRGCPADVRTLYLSLGMLGLIDSVALAPIALTAAVVLIGSGAGISEAVGVAVAVQAVGILVGGSIFLLATAWRTGLRLAPHHVAPAAVLGSRP